MVAANQFARLPRKEKDYWIHSDGLGDHVCAEISVSLGFKPAHVYCLSSLPTFCRLGWRTSNLHVLVMILSHQLPNKLDHARSHDNTGIYLLWATPWQDQNCLSKCTHFYRIDLASILTFCSVFFNIMPNWTVRMDWNYLPNIFTTILPSSGTLRKEICTVAANNSTRTPQ